MLRPYDGTARALEKNDKGRGGWDRRRDSDSGASSKAMVPKKEIGDCRRQGGWVRTGTGKSEEGGGH
jgi:hypothetical protein